MNQVGRRSLLSGAFGLTVGTALGNASDERSSAASVEDPHLHEIADVLGLDEILSGHDAALEDIRDRLALLDDSSPSFIRVRGDGIDPTGAADSTEGLKALFSAHEDGSVFVADPGATFTVSDRIDLGARDWVKGVHLRGGTYEWVSGMESKPALVIGADRSSVEGVTLINRSTPSAETGRNVAVLINANSSRVVNNHVQNFGNGILVASQSQWCNHIIAHNLIEDVWGVGQENKGYGIAFWGAQGVISENIIIAKDGTDCLLGIHLEYLQGVENKPFPTPLPYAQITVSGNIILGRGSGMFRRGITAENLRGVVVTGNSVASTNWWAIGFAMQCHSCVAVGNTILWTRTSSHNQGSNWEPTRAPLCFQGGVYACTFANNSVLMYGGTAADAIVACREIVSSAENHRPTRCIVDGVTVAGIPGQSPAPVITHVLHLLQAVDLTVKNVKSRFHSRGAYLWQCDRVTIDSCDLSSYNTGSRESAVHVLNSGDSRHTITNNRLGGSGVTNGVHAPSTRGMQIIGNRFESVVVGISGASMTNSLIGMNIFHDVTTAVVGTAGTTLEVSNLSYSG
ncbi:hypothetical protein [Microbacterium sp. NPDC055683]